MNNKELIESMVKLSAALSSDHSTKVLLDKIYKKERRGEI